MVLKLDPKKLTEDQRQKLEQYQHTQQQLQVLSDIAMMNQEVIDLLDDQKKDNGEVSQKFGALLVDMRDSLTALKDKQAPETPDYAKPVVEAVSKLEKALSASIKAIDVKPVIDAPQVSVSAPDVDLKGVEKAVSNLSKSFREAIKLIKIPEPEKTDFQPLLDAWEGISEQLVSIEHAARMKPLPGSMTIQHNDQAVSSANPLPITGSITTSPGPTDAYEIADSDTATATKYYGFTDADANWYILKEDTSTGTYRYVKGAAGASPNDYPTKWTNRATLVYRYFYEEF